MSRITGRHHVLGIEHLLREFRNGESPVLLASAGSERGESRHEEVETRKRNHVHSQLPEIRIQLTGESETSCDTGHCEGDKVVQVSVSWVRELQGSEANVVEGLIVNAVGLIGILNELVD